MIKRLCDFISINENIISDTTCEDLQSELSSNVQWILNTNFSYILFDEKFIDHNIKSRSFLNYKIYESISNVLDLNKELCKSEKIIDYGYFILNISQGSNPENIFSKSFRRSLSVIINLNCEQLNISFFNRSYFLTLNKRTSIIFPSNFMFDYQLDGSGYVVFTSMDF